MRTIQAIQRNRRPIELWLTALLGLTLTTAQAAGNSIAAPDTAGSGRGPPRWRWTVTAIPWSVVYDSSGFFSPIDNLPTVNQVKAGQAIPVTFSLIGDQGLDIFAEGYSASQEVACDSNVQVNEIEDTDTVGNSSLSYDPDSDQYSYKWK